MTVGRDPPVGTAATAGSVGSPAPCGTAAPRPTISRCRPGQRGGLAVLALGVVALAMLLLYGIALIGAAAALQARADAAADAAALAAADQLALGEGPAAAAAAAAEVAAANGARLVTCHCAGLSAEVLVSVAVAGPPGLPSRVGGRARAEADLSGWLPPDP